MFDVVIPDNKFNDVILQQVVLTRYSFLVKHHLSQGYIYLKNSPVVSIMMLRTKSPRHKNLVVYDISRLWNHKQVRSFGDVTANLFSCSAPWRQAMLACFILLHLAITDEQLNT